MAKVLMVQGTSSDVGKSVFCAALCRWLSEEGYRVAPFKAQNMALNAMVVPGGGEIGWAQVMQAEAACTAPRLEMNPLLLKPVSDTVCQVVVTGLAVGNLTAQQFQGYKKEAFPVVLAALETLRREYDVVVIEGAGSPAEVNLRSHDIVNMGLAAAAEAPVLLVADIDRGGVFASIVGTLALLSQEERERVRGLIINKFRGCTEKLRPGLTMLSSLTEKPVVGVLPYLGELSLPPEDSLSLVRRHGGSGLEAAVIALPRIANFTDYHVLAAEEGISLRYVSSPAEFGAPQLVILPGTKNTLADLDFLQESGLDAKVKAAYRSGAFLLGICGGYQMLGQRILDNLGSDGAGGSRLGLGLLPVETEFGTVKTTARVCGHTLPEGEELAGYEIHMGQTRRFGVRPFARLTTEDGKEYLDGAVSGDGRIIGTYLHGLFDAASFRQSFLNRVRRAFNLPEQQGDNRSARQQREASYRLLAASVREHLDTAQLLQLLNEA
ncbi:MAG: cobyric acid synthase [Firmicutes bacterium]|nr:cobyric acid synthase [Bacillota bacterium]